jgi:ElaB/YqjD/DUF883 family membrane-anchored ribosome-binding protein
MAGKGEGGSHPRMSTGYPGSASGQSEEERKGLKESAQEMASHASESVGQMKEKAREFVSGVAGQAQETWRSTREGLQEGLSRASGRAEDIWEDAIEFVRRYPLASLAVAFGLGCLASAALAALSRSSTEDMTERMSRASS